MPIQIPVTRSSRLSMRIVSSDGAVLAQRIVVIGIKNMYTHSDNIIIILLFVCVIPIRRWSARCIYHYHYYYYYYYVPDPRRAVCRAGPVITIIIIIVASFTTTAAVSNNNNNNIISVICQIPVVGRWYSVVCTSYITTTSIIRSFVVRILRLVEDGGEGG